jgi:tetratricopeptide (TPR) repeat protein
VVDSVPTQPDAPIDSQLIVEDVVSALMGPTGAETASGPEDLRLQLERAAAEFDKRTADAFGRALLDSLCEDPGNLRQLEALLILGLAHPDVLDRHRISLAVEGRRLAVLLERAGDVDRARGVLELLAGHMPGERTIDHELAGILRRSGNTDELVERYLRRAEAAVEEGNVSEAIPWLQEILLLDRTRRDVARMIRDLRYQEADRQTRRGRRNRLLVVLVLLSAGLTALVGREVQIRREYSALVEIDDSNPDTLYQRKQGVESVIAGHRFWIGLFSATAERDDLTQRIAEYEREASRRARAQESEDVRRTEMADAARLRALMYSERGDFSKALSDFEKALSLARDGWEHRAQVEADVAALRTWEAQGGARAK